jgi:glycosyltransferase involved in cell wall biosynthesis
MTNRPSVALIVITRNEEQLIGQCLKSAAFCEEKVVVDSFSTDRTAELASAAGARVIQREFTGYIAQKQFALEQVSCDWVLNLDADEQATYALGREIEKVLSTPSLAINGFLIRRILYHLGGYYHRGAYPDSHLRLFRRGSARFGGREPHAKALVSGRIGRLRAPILHFSDRDVASHIETMNRLTSVAALHGEPGPLSVLQMLTHPAWRFLNFYLLRGGFLDGGRGLYGALAASFYVFLKYAKRYERRLKNRRL